MGTWPECGESDVRFARRVCCRSYASHVREGEGGEEVLKIPPLLGVLRLVGGIRRFGNWISSRV